MFDPNKIFDIGTDRYNKTDDAPKKTAPAPQTPEAPKPRYTPTRTASGSRDLGERAAARREEKERTQQIFDDYRKAQDRTIEIKRDILGRLAAGDQSLFDIMIEALEGLAIATDDGRFYLESYRLLMGSEAPDEVKARFGLLDEPEPEEPLQVEEPAPAEEAEAAAPMVEAPFAFDVLHFPDHLFYDIETFRYYWLVVFKDIEHNVVAEYKIEGNEIEQIAGKRKSIKTLVKDKWLVGFNNYHYDDYSLALAIATKDNELLKSLNDWIFSSPNRDDYTRPFKWVHEGAMGERYTLKDLKLTQPGGYKLKYPFKKSLDCMQQIKKGGFALKKIEGHFGLNIRETEIPFDLDRELTKEEKDSTIEYCEADVDATINVFKARYHSYFVPKSELVAQLPEGSDPDSYRKNDTSLSAMIISGSPKPEKQRAWPEMNLGDRQEWILSQAPEAVREVWLPWNPLEVEEAPKIPAFEAFGGCEIKFGGGGLHGVRRRSGYSDLINLDVTSMYPSILLNINGLGSWTKEFEKIVTWRKRIKHSEPILQKALKLVINSVYGNLNSKKSPLYNPNVYKSVVIYGQVSLYNLAERLYQAGHTIVQVNTDGVAFTGSGACDYREIQRDWERDWKINLEEDRFSRLYQKDVNSYVAVYEDDDSHLKAIGDVKNYNNGYDSETEEVIGNTLKANSGSIIDRSIVAYILDGIEPIETIRAHLREPILFQYICHSGSGYKTIDTEGREYQNTNRIFAAKEGGVQLQRIGGKQKGASSFAKRIKHQRIYNEALDTMDLDSFAEWIDLDYYENEAWRKLKQWGFSREG